MKRAEARVPNWGRLRRAVFALLLLMLGGAVNEIAVAQSNLTKGLLAYWSFDNGTATNPISADYQGTLLGNFAIVDGYSGKALRFNGTNTSISFGAKPYLPKMTLAMFVLVDTQFLSAPYPAALAYKWGSGENFRILAGNVGGNFRFNSSFHAAPFPLNGTVYPEQGVDATNTVATGQFHHVVITYDGDYLRLYLDGELNNQSATRKSPYSASIPGGIPFTIGSLSDGSWPFNGIIDEVFLFDRALSDAEIGLLSAPTITITDQPRNAFALLDGTANFSVAASPGGFVLVPGPLSYQWLFNASPIGGATNSALTISSVQSTNAGSYSVIVRNPTGTSVTSSNGTLTIVTAGQDVDHDGLLNETEVLIGTNPLSPDTDGDGLSDYDEIFVYHTNPLSPDTDSDGIPDKWEIDHGLNPRVNDATEIGPGGVSNLQIYQYDQDPTHTNQLDPHNPFFAPGTSIYEVLNNGQHTNRFYYDRNDRLIGAEYSRGLALAYTYDGNGNLIRQTLLSRAAETNGLPILWRFLHGLTNTASAFADTDGDGWTDWQEWKAGTDPRNPLSKPGLLGNPGTNIASLTLPFTPSNFVVGVGQLDGLGAEEIVLGGDGNPGTNANFLLVLTQGATTWSTQRVDLGPFGVTSLAVGQVTNRPGSAIYAGLREPGGRGRIVELIKVGGTWQTNVVATSTNEAAFAIGVLDGYGLLATFASTNGSGQLFSLTASNSHWNFQLIDTNRSHRGLGLLAKASDTNSIVLRLLDRGNILAMDAGSFLDGMLPFGGIYRIESDSWYFLLPSPMSWPIAEANAQSYGGHLVTINSQAENDWLVSQFGAFGVNLAWIGFTDEANEGSFVWSSGEPATFTNWLPGEPNNESNGDYGVIQLSSTGKWDDGNGLYQGVVEVPRHLPRHQIELTEPPALLPLLHPGLSLAAGRVRFNVINGHSIFYSFADDKNRSGGIDSGDDFVTAEYWVSGTNASLLTTNRQPIASLTPAQSYGLASVNFLNRSNEVFFTGEPDGQVFAWTATGATNPLQRQLFSAHHAGKAWHALAAVKTVEPGEGLIGLQVDPSAPKTCDVILWPPQPQLPQLANLPNTAPAAAVLPSPSPLGSLAAVTVRLWDAEGNASTPFLQYQLAGSTNWQDATLVYLDGALYNPSARVPALPGGTNYTVVWNALMDLRTNIVTNVLLRARARDFSLLGNWSQPTPFQVDLTTSADIDGDGLPDWWELQHFGTTAYGPSDDPDHDGFANWAEYLADTDPMDPNSFLGISGVRLQDGGVRVDWHGGRQATQYLQRTFSLTDTNAPWQDIFTNPPPTPITGSFTDLVSTNLMQFYRLRVMR